MSTKLWYSGVHGRSLIMVRPLPAPMTSNSTQGNAVTGALKYDILDLNDYPDYRRPGLQLTVDFTDIMSANSKAKEGADIFEDSLQIWLSFTEDIEDSTNAAPPIPLLPGADLLSFVDFSIRQKLKPSALATFGFAVGFRNLYVGEAN